MKVYLIRHGQSTSDIEGKYGGTYNDHLTDEGRMQTEKLAVRLKNNQIHVVYYSPLFRTKETALIVQQKTKSEMYEVQDLKERNKYGILTGVTKSEALKTYPQLVGLLENDHNTIIDAEPYDTFRERIVNSFTHILQTNNQTFAVVTHGGPIKVILKEIFGRDVRAVQDCGIVIIKKSVEALTIVSTEGIIV